MYCSIKPTSRKHTIQDFHIYIDVEKANQGEPNKQHHTAGQWLKLFNSKGKVYTCLQKPCQMRIPNIPSTKEAERE